jgi:hypothetical protein
LARGSEDDLNVDTVAQRKMSGQGSLMTKFVAGVGFATSHHKSSSPARPRTGRRDHLARFAVHQRSEQREGKAAPVVGVKAISNGSLL